MKTQDALDAARTQLGRVVGGRKKPRSGKKRLIIVTAAAASLGALGLLAKRSRRPGETELATPKGSSSTLVVHLGNNTADTHTQVDHSGVIISVDNNHPVYRLKINTGTKVLEVVVSSAHALDRDVKELTGAHAFVYVDPQGDKPDLDKPIEAVYVMISRV